MFRDRTDAGRQLAAMLSHLQDQQPVVLGLPRGGVAVAAEIARQLDAPLDVLVVRKLGAPGRPELAIGAVTNGGGARTVLNEEVVRATGTSERYLQEETQRQLETVRERQESYRRGRPAIEINGRTVIVVDDGIATGATVRAALTALRQSDPRHLVLAVPVGPPESMNELRSAVDELVYVDAPPGFMAVGQYYQDFRQVTDEEVIALLADARSA